MWLLKARDFSFVSVFVSSNWYFYKPLFVIAWVSRRQKSIECCRASERERERQRERCEFCWLTDHKINKSTDLVTGKRMGHFKIVCVNDRWRTWSLPIYNNNTNNHIQRCNLRFLTISLLHRHHELSPTSGLDAIVCKPCATHGAFITCNMCCVPHSRKGQLSY